jgi:hypothetical protein
MDREFSMDSSVHEITSGGERVGEAPAAVLCIDKELATAYYKLALAAFLADPEITHWWYVEAPIADHWNMTSTTKDGTHRIAELRWSVTAKIGVLREPVVLADDYRVDGWDSEDAVNFSVDGEPRFPIEKKDRGYRGDERKYGDPTL